VVDTGKRWIMPGWIFTHIASGEKRDPVNRGQAKTDGGYRWISRPGVL
jgi:hypothetical protein